MDPDTDQEIPWLNLALSSTSVQGVFISTDDNSTLPVIGFSLKGAIITGDFFPFTGEGRAAGGGRLGRENEIAPGPCNSDRRGCE